MGLTFGAVGGAFFSLLAGVGALFFPGAEDEWGFMIIAGSVWGFAIGVSFSAVLAVAGRCLAFDRLSLPRVAALGAGGGLLLALLLVAATWNEWPDGNAIVPFTILPLLGAGAATGSLLLARRAGPVLASGDESRSLQEGGDESRGPEEGGDAGTS